MRRHPVLSRTALSLTGALGLHAGAAGGEDPSLLAIDRLLSTPVITATRTSLRADRAPATVIVVTEEQIRQRRYRSIIDLLRDLPEVKVDDGSDYIGTNAVTMRGLRGNATQKLMILMDGVRITGPTNEPVPLLDNFPIHFARQVEIVYGPGSALYGADAFSGVINIITRDKEETGTDLGLGGGTDGLAFGRFYHQMNLGDSGHLLVAGNGAYDRQPDLSEDWPEVKQGVDSWRNITGVSPIDPAYAAPLQSNAFFARFNLDGLSASLFHRYAKNPSNTANRTDSAIFNKDVFLAFEQDTARVNYQARVGEVDTDTGLTGQRLRLNPKSNYRNVFTGQEYGYKYTYSESVRFDEQLTWRPRPDMTVTGGFSLESSTAVPWLPEMQSPVDDSGPIRGKFLGTNTDVDVYTTHDTQEGAFGQVEYAPVAELSLVGGLRIDRSNRYGTTRNPRLGMVWTPTADWTFKALYGTAFLAPSPFDAFVYYGSFAGGFFHLPNPRLEPQTLKTTELSARRTLGRSFSLSLNLYETKVDKLFVAASDDGNTNYYNHQFKGQSIGYIEVYVNQGRQRMTGGTLKLDYLQDWGEERRLQAWASVSRIDGDVHEAASQFKEVELPNVAPATYRLGADLRWGRVSFSPRWVKMNEQRTQTPDPAHPDKRLTVAGYSRLDATLSVRLLQGLDVFLDAQNATDARYRNVSFGSRSPSSIEYDGTPQNPRRISVGFEWKF